MATITNNELLSPDNGVMTEKQINLIFRRLNNGKLKDDDFWNAFDKTKDGLFELTPEQIEKGYKWLLNQWKTPAGKERFNNPFDAREEYVLNNFRTIYFSCIYPAGDNRFVRYIPVYRVEAHDGTGFEYYVWRGKIEFYA